VKLKKDPRSALVDFEYEEHKLRLKILTSQLQTELMKQAAERRKASIMEEEHKKRMELLDNQIANTRVGHLEIVQLDSNQV
jgi:hypothetical protein